MPDTDPFVALARIQEKAKVALAGLGLQLERFVAEAGDGSGPRVMQMIVTAIPDWDPDALDDGFDEMIEHARQAEQVERAERTRENLEDLQDRLRSDGGFL